MKATPRQIAEAFSGHMFEKTYPYLHEKIIWNMINGDVLKGKDAIIKTCDESAKYLANVKTTFKKFKNFVGDSYVVIDSLSEYVDKKKEKSVVASCDIYEFKENKIIEITSYTVEVPSD